MSTSSSQLLADVERLHTDSGLMHEVIHGDASTTVVTDGGPIPSVAKAINTMTAFNVRGAWATATAYALKDLFTDGTLVYVVTKAHTSSTVAADLAAGRIALYQGVMEATTDRFVAPANFTAGTTTQLTLSRKPGTKGNATVYFGGVYQNPTNWSLSGNVITFTSAIPVGVDEVSVVIGTMSTATAPSAASIDDEMVQPGSRLYVRINDETFVTDPEFGAVGGGVHDDCPAFAAALAAASAAGGGRVRVPYRVGGYYLSQGITVPNGVELCGDLFLPGNDTTMTKLIFANGTAVCVELNGAIAGVGGGTAALRRTLVTRQGATPPNGSIGVRISGLYNSILEDVYSLKHYDCFYWLGQGNLPDMTLANGIACTATRIYTGAATGSHFVLDSWPELRVTQGRAGMNGYGDFAGKSFIRITSPNGGVGGSGPNTIVFDNYQFNQGGTAGPDHWLHFTNNTAGVGNQVLFMFTNCHMENNTAAVIKSDADAPQLQRLIVTGGMLNAPARALFDLNAATNINNVTFNGVHLAVASITPAVNYINGLTFTGCAMGAVASIFNAPPTNNWSVSLVGNSWGAGSSLAIQGSGWASCLVADIFSFDSTYTDTSGSKNVMRYGVGGALKTWVPQLLIGGSAAGITASTAIGNWQLQGRLLTLNFKIILTSKGSNSGNVTIGNLPFPATGDALDGAAGKVSYYQAMAGVTGGLDIYPASSTQLGVVMPGAAQSAPLTNANLANNSLFYGSISYFI